MSSPNDITAKAFDIVYEKLVCERRTRGEVDFVISKLDRGDAILDVGCGTGRHMIPLLKMGYKVVGIDNSKEMLRVLSEKLQANNLRAEIICQNVLKAQPFHGKFGGIICFWNAIAEMAKTRDEAATCLRFFFDSLQINGKAIIEQISPALHAPKPFAFNSLTRRNGIVYKTINEIINIDVERNTTILRELIEIEKDGKRVESLKTEIVQKWWAMNELEVLSEEAGFTDCEFFGPDFLPLKSSSGRFVLVAKK